MKTYVEYYTFPTLIKEFTIELDSEKRIKFTPTQKTITNEDNSTSIEKYLEVSYHDDSITYSQSTPVQNDKLAEFIRIVQQLALQVNNSKNETTTLPCK